MNSNFRINITLMHAINISSFCKNIFYYRFLLSFILFIISVFFEIHGSSIGIYSQILNSPDIVLFGKNRPIRSDEWFVNTPLEFSQYYNAFPYFSDIVRAHSTDMFLMYGQAVKDWPVIFRPFHWGYLILDPGKGLSFFWMGRLIALFLSSFELGRIITKDKHFLSFTYAIIMTFSPIIQWWFAVNSIAEILIFSQCIVICCFKYFISESRKRLLYIIGFIYSSISYIFSLYPAWQVPCAYVFFVVLLSLIFEYKKMISVKKTDIGLFLLSFILIAIISVDILFKSIDVIKITKDTVYPGSRFCTTAGISILDFINFGCNYALGMWLPIKDVLYTNNCEISRMFDFSPLGLILAGIYFLKNKKWNYMIKFLVGLQVFFLAWCIFNWPAWFAKITFMYNVTFRIILAIGIINVILLIRILAIWKYSISRTIQITLSIFMALFSAYTVYISSPTIFNFKYYTITFFTIFILCFFVLSKHYKCFSVMTVLLLIWSGGMVNPISHTAASISESSLIKNIQYINENDPGIWITEGDELGIQNIPIMAGAATINSINTYPVLARWGLLDKNHDFKNIYNRYAHITMIIGKENNNKFILNFPDHFTVFLQNDDLRKLQVQYILTKNKLDLSDTDVRYTMIYNDNNFYIYKLQYLW
ncbi:hypothetical protein [Mitsuokella sp. AF33-22]|uniref:DUF7657 domain-containing protein n=1 Tax=Mitsuokella sp. AF33-22 TaxID=2292047 RepID=UPI0011C35501|nr:hypothetical protein [Mitsuokella sp. AF33-22]